MSEQWQQAGGQLRLAARVQHQLLGPPRQRGTGKGTSHRNHRMRLQNGVVSTSGDHPDSAGASMMPPQHRRDLFLSAQLCVLDPRSALVQVASPRDSDVRRPPSGSSNSRLTGRPSDHDHRVRCASCADTCLDRHRHQKDAPTLSFPGVGIRHCASHVWSQGPRMLDATGSESASNDLPSRGAFQAPQVVPPHQGRADVLDVSRVPSHTDPRKRRNGELLRMSQTRPCPSEEAISGLEAAVCSAVRGRRGGRMEWPTRSPARPVRDRARRQLCEPDQGSPVRPLALPRLT
jgi:hypothetical protein